MKASTVSNSSTDILAIINTDDSEPSDNVSCTASNPNSYVERIQIQVDASGLVAETNGRHDESKRAIRAIGTTLLMGLKHPHSSMNMTPSLLLF